MQTLEVRNMVKTFKLSKKQQKLEKSNDKQELIYDAIIEFDLLNGINSVIA